MSSPAGPNPLRVAWSIWRARRVRPPRPRGDSTTGHDELAAILTELRRGGVPILAGRREELAAYRRRLEALDPDAMAGTEALAYWLNLYNAGALDLAAEAGEAGEATVLRVPGGFARSWTTVAGEELSLDDIEHGKIRRFRDPRIHGSLVCGSASCPTLRYEPFSGAGIGHQLDDQMRAFLDGGGALADEAGGRLHLSRVFLWYGGDFTRPHRMPTLLPARRQAIADALGTWLPAAIESWRLTAGPRIEFQTYDWSLACAIG